MSKSNSETRGNMRDEWEKQVRETKEQKRQMNQSKWNVESDRGIREKNLKKRQDERASKTERDYPRIFCKTNPFCSAWQCMTRTLWKHHHHPLSFNMTCLNLSGKPYWVVHSYMYSRLELLWIISYRTLDITGSQKNSIQCPLTVQTHRFLETCSSNSFLC